MRFRSTIAVAGPIAAAPAAGEIAVGTRTIGSRDYPAVRSNGDGEHTLQNSEARSQITAWQATGSAVLPVALGANAITALGTLTARAQSTTSRVTRAKRLGLVSSAAAGSLAGLYYTAANWTIGNGSAGGFTATFIFAPSDAATVSGARMFVGMSSNVAAPTNVEASTLTNSIGVAAISTSANLNLVYGGSTAQTAIDLGTNFPANGLSAALYELIITASMSGAIGYQLTRLDTGLVASGIITNTTPGTTLPANTLFLSPRAWRCTNASAVAVGLDIASIYIEGNF